MQKSDFVDAIVLKLNDDSHIFVEKKLQGKYQKYTGNDGCDNSKSVQYLNALSHYSWVVTGRLILVDFQGTAKLLRDPAIHHANNYPSFGANHGQKGIDKFMKEHKCSVECKVLGLDEEEGEVEGEEGEGS
jgi:hypothetical protein